MPTTVSSTPNCARIPARDRLDEPISDASFFQQRHLEASFGEPGRAQRATDASTDDGHAFVLQVPVGSDHMGIITACGGLSFAVRHPGESPREPLDSG